MSTKTAVQPIPAGMPTLTPHLTCDGAADAIEFYKKAFNAVEQIRIALPNGRLMHANLRIGTSSVMLVDTNPEWGNLGPKDFKGVPIVLHLYVENADAAIDQAVAAGAKLVMPAADMFWGDRYGQVEDPFGYRWSIATHIKDMTAEEMQEAAKTAFSKSCQ